MQMLAGKLWLPRQFAVAAPGNAMPSSSAPANTDGMASMAAAPTGVPGSAGVSTGASTSSEAETSAGTAVAKRRKRDARAKRPLLQEPPCTPVHTKPRSPHDDAMPWAPEFTDPAVVAQTEKDRER